MVITLPRNIMMIVMLTLTLTLILVKTTIKQAIPTMTTELGFFTLGLVVKQIILSFFLDLVLMGHL